MKETPDLYGDALLEAENYHDANSVVTDGTALEVVITTTSGAVPQVTTKLASC